MPDTPDKRRRKNGPDQTDDQSQTATGGTGGSSGTEPTGPQAPAAGQSTSVGDPREHPGPDAGTEEQQAAADEHAEEQAELAPEPPVEVAVTPGAPGTVIFPIVARDPDVDVPDDASLYPEPAEPEDRFEGLEVLEAEPVEFVNGAADTNGLVLNINGTPYGFTSQMTGALKQIVDKTVVGLSL